jgi:hypothetical protein
LGDKDLGVVPNDMRNVGKHKANVSRRGKCGCSVDPYELGNGVQDWGVGGRKHETTANVSKQNAKQKTPTVSPVRGFGVAVLETEGRLHMKTKQKQN